LEVTLKLAPGMHVEWIEGEAVILDPESGDLHYLNGTAALVYALIEEHGYDDAMTELSSRYADSPAFDAELKDLLDDMKEKGILVE
jgi:hypothetical protein